MTERATVADDLREAAAELRAAAAELRSAAEALLSAGAPAEERPPLADQVRAFAAMPRRGKA